MVKRDPEDELSETGSEGDTDKTAVETTRKKAKPSPSKSKSTTPSPTKATQKVSPFGPSSSQSAKSKLAEIIMECGIKNFSRPEAQIRVSLSSPTEADEIDRIDSSATEGDAEPGQGKSEEGVDGGDREALRGSGTEIHGH
jgi:hypothetical protein